MDLSDWSASRAAAEKCLPVDMLVNNVGAASNVPFEDVSEADVDRLMAVNLKSMINVTQVTPDMTLLSIFAYAAIHSSFAQADCSDSAQHPLVGGKGLKS